MPAHRPTLAARIVRIASFAIVCFAFGVAGAVGTAAFTASRLAPTIVTGRETIRFPEANRCGIVAWRRDRPGAVEVTVQTGTIIRMGNDFESAPHAVERLVPAWVRDRAVPWGWDGPWQIGLRSVRHLILIGWPWPAFMAVMEAQGDSNLGPGGWRVIEGTVRGPAPTSPWDPNMPRLWPAVTPRQIHWPGLLANTLVFAAASAVVLLAGLTSFHMLRRYRRLARGCCVACGYRISGPMGVNAHATCPECGVAFSDASNKS
jgi:hypothetical protein